MRLARLIHETEDQTESGHRDAVSKTGPNRAVSLFLFVTDSQKRIQAKYCKLIFPNLGSYCLMKQQKRFEYSNKFKQIPLTGEKNSDLAL